MLMCWPLAQVDSMDLCWQCVVAVCVWSQLPPSSPLSLPPSLSPDVQSTGVEDMEVGKEDSEQVLGGGEV